MKYNNKARKLCEKAKNTKNPQHFEHYKKYRQTLTRLKLSVRRQFYSNLFQRIGKNAKMLWEVLNRLMKKVNNKTEITSIITDKGKIRDPREISNKLNKYFTDVGKKIQKSIHVASKCTIYK